MGRNALDMCTLKKKGMSLNEAIEQVLEMLEQGYGIEYIEDEICSLCKGDIRREIRATLREWVTKKNY